MKNTLIAVAVMGLAALSSAAAVSAKAGPEREGEFRKGVHACFADICIGDRVEDLAAIDFDTIVLRSNAELLARKKIERFPRTHREDYGFWDDSLMKTVFWGHFDESFIPLAARYEHLCPDDLPGNRELSLTGTYRTKTGLATTVNITHLPDIDDPDLKARFFITAIERTVPFADSGERQRIIASVNERYEAFFAPGSLKSENRHLRSHVQAFAGSGRAGIQVAMRWKDDPLRARLSVERWSKLNQAPRCTSQTTPGID